MATEDEEKDRPTAPAAAWQLTSGQGDQDRIDALLADGWEPFAATGGISGYVYHFRRLG